MSEVKEVYKLSQQNHIYYVIFDENIVGIDVNFDGSVSETDYINEDEFDNIVDSLEEVSISDVPDNIIKQSKEFHS